MERKEAIRSAYRLTGGNNFYDGMITCSTLSGKAVCRLVWDMNKAENDAYLEKALSGIPEHFSGKLLEVPVGTGILTMPLYKTLPKADITCLDYSADMMGQAQEKADRLHLKNVTFRQGDVGALPYADGVFDAVKMIAKTWLKSAKIKDVGAYFAVSDAAKEIGTWDSRLQVTSRGYMLGYNDLRDPSVSGFFRFLARVGDNGMKMQIVKIRF